jgi:RNA polymerase sigma-70 factor (ECF subfamily)
MVLSARVGKDTQSREALEKLCGRYWAPLYAFIRRQGESPHDAQDLTQAFFTRLFEKDYVWRWIGRKAASGRSCSPR